MPEAKRAGAGGPGGAEEKGALESMGARGARAPGSKAEASPFRLLPWLIVGTNAFGLVAAGATIAAGRVGSVELGIFVVFFAVTLLGVEVGNHRLFSHRAFEAAPAVEVFLAVTGNMALLGTSLLWATVHRIHHRFSDRAGDPHSPYVRGDGTPLPRWRGLLYSHVLWHLDERAVRVDFRDLYRYSRGLLRNRRLLAVDRLSYGWVALGLALPAAAGWALRGDADGAWLGFLWGGPIRIAAVHHAIWAVNSLAHSFGTRPFDSGDRSTNLWWLALLTHGGGWHNNHHAFPASARAGIEPWQIDTGYWFVRALERLGLVWDVRLPAASRGGPSSAEGRRAGGPG